MNLSPTLIRLVLSTLGVGFLGSCIPGCALEKSIDAATSTARAIAEKGLDKCDLGALMANAEADQPAYVVDGMFGSGFHLKVQLEGVKVRGSFQGQLSPRTDSDADMRQRLHEELSGQGLTEKVIDAILSRVRKPAASQPAQ